MAVNEALAVAPLVFVHVYPATVALATKAPVFDVDDEFATHVAELPPTKNMDTPPAFALCTKTKPENAGKFN